MFVYIAILQTFTMDFSSNKPLKHCLDEFPSFVITILACVLAVNHSNV